jgi:UDP-N-acetylglucosamine--N-acetylmuramyl-(pentapeptide) pyrophosphoryl-undecaprenol N-acetylglucosamine transferase
MRMIVAGGGTGGHLFPGLAVAESLDTNGRDDVLFIGSAFGIEARVIPRTRFPFHALDVRGVRGRGLRGPLQLAWRIPRATWRAWRLIGEFGGQLVLGVGGYASFPVVVAAWLRRVPSVLLEQNARPGLANRVLARLARRVCTTFAEARQHLPADKVVLTGNPVRPFAVAPRVAGDGFTVLIFGGSQGARRLNEAAADAAATLVREVPGLRIIHQTGQSDHERLAARYAALGAQAEARVFIDDMGAAYAQADLVVCRAGATTVAEITALGKAAVLVPYPFAADDHQRANAEVLVAAGAALMVLDHELDASRLAAIVRELADDRPRLRAMGAAAQRLGRPDAAAQVVAVCRAVVGEGAVDG